MTLDELIRHALAEDLGDGDHTSLSTIPAGHQSLATVRAKSPGIIAGVEAALRVVQSVDPAVQSTVLEADGTKVVAGTSIIQFTGPTRSLLQAERLLLNIMQRMSGIATMTRSFVDTVEGTSSTILDTRKTTPNLRLLEKWAVRLGGGQNHRFGLFDMILIKDNHVDAAGGIIPALQRAQDYLISLGRTLPIEIETRNLDEVRQALEFGKLNRIMLDNFPLEQLREAIGLIGKRVETEASGGITLSTVRQVAETGVDFISVGALTHSYYSMDISMKIVPQ